MALRVLLADESTTIKKVMQLALQDFAVEVKAVHSGLDVSEVARGFSPDIVFADVLLQKKNGYEVCAELKRDSKLSGIPTVLMWSSFMDLDEKAAGLARADRRLEKPFDVENLRQLVMELVPKTRSQRLAHFLNFSAGVTAPLEDEEKRKNAAQGKAHPAPSTGAGAISARGAPEPSPSSGDPAANWNMESFDEIEEFTSSDEVIPQTKIDRDTPDDEDGEETFEEIRFRAKDSAPEPMETTATSERLSRTGEARRAELTENERLSRTGEGEGGADRQKAPARADDQEIWSHQNLQRFRVDVEEPAASEHDEVEFDVVDDTTDPRPQPKQHARPASDDLELEHTEMIEPVMPQIELTGDEAGLEAEEDDGLELTTPKGRLQPTSRGLSQDAPIQQLSTDRLEEIVRAQSREVIEALVRRIVPDLASEIIRQELERLLEEPR